MPYNITILHHLYGLALKYRVLRSVAEIISGPLSFIGFPLIFLATLLFSGSGLYYWLYLVGSTVAATWLIAELLKRIIQIPRPYLVYSEIKPVRTTFGYAFPSEHASVYAALALLSWFYTPLLGVLFSAIAVLVGISRIVLGVHYPSDVIAGYILGSSVSFLFIIFFFSFL